MKILKIENTKDYRGDVITVSKNDFEIYKHLNDYYSISLNNSMGGNKVWGGDSAWKDCYDESLVNDIFNTWDGTLHYEGNKYGYKISLD